MRFKGILVRQYDSTSLMLTITRENYATIADHSKIDVLDNLNRTGSQRTPDPNRLRDLRKYLNDSQARLLNNVILNYRREYGELEFTPVDGGHEVEIDLEKGCFYIPDGSHRFSAYRGFCEDLGKAMNEDPFDVMLIITNMTIDQEREQFSIINCNAQAPSMAHRHIVNCENRDFREENGLCNKAIPRKNRIMDTKEKGYDLARILNCRNDGPFDGNILCNQIDFPEGTNNGFYKVNGFADSHKHIVSNKNSFFPEVREDQAVIVSEWWKAIHKVFPGSFTRDHGIIKNVGLLSFPKLLFLIMEKTNDYKWDRSNNDWNTKPAKVFPKLISSMKTYGKINWWLSSTGGVRDIGGQYGSADRLALKMLDEMMPAIHDLLKDNKRKAA